MKYSYNWLKEISGTKNSPEKTAEMLTMHSFELEGMEKIGNDLEGVVVGKILEIKKHPNADKLQIAKVDVEKKGERESRNELLIVCGAPNIQVGQKVPVAMIGAKLPNGLEIKQAEIRGEKSFGMLCALDELGLGKDHSGIFILDKNAKIGEPAKKYLGVEDDTIFEIKVLPDRAHDAMSHVGVAREISVLENKKFAYDFDGLKLSNKKSKKLKVEIKDKKLCSRYIGVVMAQVEIKDSPNWMKKRLENCGIRPINNVVDATNYVMLELGQPMHAFDFFKIKSEISNDKNQISNKFQKPNDKCQIIVRRAKDNEKLVLLDDSILELKSSDLLITNGEMPLALAGIMGGKDSGINENTKTIVLEAANFNATNIRRSRTRLNVKTESSDRFEKEIDPNLCAKAMTRIIEILERTAEAKLEGVVDIYPNKIKPWKVKLDLEYVNSLLGEIVSQKEVVKILNLLGINTQQATSNKQQISCEIPTYRIDLKTEEDLIEEIGRIWGYEKIEVKPMIESVLPAKANEILSLERKIQEKLAYLGFDEMYNYSFYSRQDAKNCGLDGVKHYELANAMSPEQDLVRVSLIPNILKNVRENLKHFDALNIFEIGRAYFPNDDAVEEKRMLVMAQVLGKDQHAETFYNIKNSLENLLESFGIENVRFVVPTSKSENLAHKERCAEIEIGKEKIGMIGEISPVVLGKYKIEKRVAMVDIDLEKMLKIIPREKNYKPISKFPEVVRDISMIVPENVSYFEIEKNILQSGGDLVENVSLFDYFPAKNSLAVRISMNGKTRTLESKEVDGVMEKIVLGLKKELGLEIRR